MLHSTKVFVIRKSLLRFSHRFFVRSFCDNISSKPPLSILFYGSDDFSIESLKLLKSRHLRRQENSRWVSNLEVVTTSRNNPIYSFCKKSDLQCHLFEEYSVPSQEFDVGVVSSFGRLIPAKSIEACKFGMLNIHGSLLPRWRGASPIQRAILAGDKETGVTIMTVRPKKFDIGKIVAQRKIDLFYRLTNQDLRTMMAPLGAQLLWQCIENLEQSLAQAIDQPESGVTYAPKILEHEGEIDWNIMDSKEIDRRVRAFVGCVEMTTQWIDGTTLRLYDPVDPDLVARLDLNSIIASTNTEHCPGTVYYHKKRHFICIEAKNRTWIAFRAMTLKGRKKMSALGFYNTFMRPLKKAAKLANEPPPVFIVGKHRMKIESESIQQ